MLSNNSVLSRYQTILAEINEIYEEAFGDNKPARSCTGRALPKGALIEIEVIAVK